VFCEELVMPASLHMFSRTQNWLARITNRTPWGCHIYTETNSHLWTPPNTVLKFSTFTITTWVTLFLT